MKASKWMRCLTLTLVAVLLCPFGLMANNIRIIGTPEVKKKDDGKTAAINFTLAWDNSWKSSKPVNWDAAWIYVKCWDGDQWNHVYLEGDGKHTPGNSDLPNYRVTNRDGSGRKMPMTIECGKSLVYKKWHVNPEEEPTIATVGVFLFRKDSLGAGDVVIPGISLLWNYADQGFVEDDDLVVKVFAVEMVYVPQGAFYLGGKGNSAWQVASFTTDGAAFGTPMYVKAESAITLANDNSETSLWSIAGMAPGTLPEAFPKGYQAFYIMKYELTQEAYADFLNTLNQGQQDGRIQGTLASIGVTGSIWNGSANGVAHLRNYIEVSQRAPTVTFGVDANNNDVWNETVTVEKPLGTDMDSCQLSVDGQDLAVNCVSMYDLLAYADFAGLRPMTELEYEKACRGDRPVVNDEYAWGSVTITWFCRGFHTTNGNYFTWANDAIYNINKGNEQVPPQFNSGATRSGGWAVQSERRWWGDWRYRWNQFWHSAPLRVGCFADSTSTRAAAGSTYWGVMNMSDNCSELCISVGNTNGDAEKAAGYPGRDFVGVHGDGQLMPNGNADVADWAITATPAYYIPRGMNFYTVGWHGWTGWSGWGGSHPGDQYQARRNIDELWGVNIQSGMVSSRANVNHAIAGTTREITTLMPGIRCVRTANAPK